jgi:pimeloyl-ACP methyl ester carboxylesterase
MCNEKLWSELLSLFDDSYELVHVTIPNKCSFDEIVDSLYFEEQKINLLGFSLGGYIAAYYAVKYPNRINRLFIMGSTLTSISEEEIFKRQVGIDLVSAYGFKGLSRQKIKSLLADENINNENLITLIQTMYTDLGEDIFMNQMKSTLKRANLIEKLFLLNVPIWFFYSKEDRLLEYNSLMESTNKNIVIESIEGNSHMLPLEKPTLCYNKISKWIIS